MSERKSAPAGWIGFAIDFGPLLLFFLAYRLSEPKANPLTATLTGTVVFMVATVAAMGISWLRHGRVSPMLWLSAVLVIGFGALTLYFRDPAFIQHKPTIIYLLFATVLGLGLLKGEALLKRLLAAAYEGLSNDGWRLLSRNWAIFFVGMAALNEVLVAVLSFDTWLTIKVWGVTGLSLVFALANVPMMMRHGLVVDKAKAAAPPKS